MDNHKKVPSIRFKGFTNDWEQYKLSDIVTISKGTQINRANLYNYGKYYVLNGGMTPSGYTNTFNTKANTISVSEGGNSCGFVAYNTVDFWSGGHNYTLLHPKINVKFLYQYLKQQEAKIMALRVGSGLPNIQKNRLSVVLISVPNVHEQKIVSDFLFYIDNLITLHQQKHDKLLNIKKAMLKKMFPKEGEKVPEIRFKGFSDDWEQHKLGDMIEYIVDNRGKNPRYYCTEGIPVIDNYMIKNTLYPEINTANRFIDEGLFESFIRKYNEKDDVLITLVGNGIGNVTLFPDDKAVIIQNTLGLRAKDDKRFLLFLLMAYNKKLVALDRGMAQPSIRQDELLDLDIYVPDGEEQTKIGMYFVNLDNLSTLHQRKIEKLKNIKKAMLEKMFV